MQLETYVKCDQYKMLTIMMKFYMYPKKWYAVNTESNNISIH